eukprot:Nitzschia sp. Nitz4//scaffold341_size29662//2839//3990//NITZ4_008034-RA/size29662-processed-gene-0.18-mRNA-1//1//CDS//3329548534//721//frame0
MERATEPRERLIDEAFDNLEKKELDGMTTMQLRHELQASLEDQVASLFRAFGRVDQEKLAFDLDEPDESANALINQILKDELEKAEAALANPNSEKAPKGASPATFLEIKQGALKLLLDRRGADSSDSDNAVPSEAQQASDKEEASNTWLESDFFGYHETIDQRRNELIRQYQSVNMCRAAKLRDDWGYSVVALKSSIPGAGRGVFVDGYAKAGSILAFQPGQVWSKESLLNLPVDVERQLEKNDHFQMSLRPDDFMIDSRKSPYTVLTGSNSNSMALGHIVNHPSPSNPSNCRTVMVNFTGGMDLDETLQNYIPNVYKQPRTLMGTLFDRETTIMHGMALIATRDICNEELFYDYRLMTSKLPSWYHKEEDKTYEDETEDTD